MPDFCIAKCTDGTIRADGWWCPAPGDRVWVAWDGVDDLRVFRHEHGPMPGWKAMDWPHWPRGR
jgi:hypothetical protein